jgi:NACalpha-BTF3-like transcription factor
MDIDTLRNALMGLKGETPEIPYDTEANQRAAIEQSNAAVENPNTQTKPERIEAVQEQKSLETPEGQVEQARDIASLPSNPSAETNIRSNMDKKDDDKSPQPSAEMMKYKALIDKMEALQNKPKQETTWQDSLPDALAGLHNIINYNAGNPTANMQMGSLDKKKAAIAAGRKEEIGGLKNLQEAYQKYMELQNKSKDKKGDKNKIFQTRSGLVQLGEDGKPVQIFKDPYMESGRKVKEDSLELRKDNFELTKEMKGRLSDTEVESVNRFDDGVRILDDIDDLLKNTDVSTDLGPYASRAESAQQYIPGMEMDEPFVKTQQLVGIQLADYVKSISGAQVSEEEAQRLLKNIPNMSDKPIAFKTKLDQFRKDLKDSKDLYLDNIGIQKKGAEKFKEGTKSSEEYNTSQERGIENVMKNNNVSREQAIRALKKAKKL